ncbi:hypothetical protein [Treponema sp. UBA3813]|uniref:hypothetical protein n=1 Tax=Treponema sp. UBA3813 TaxID=1947715 RepID=UPI0025F72DE4|nr:hypothetical protein [Treponema sp. UBA3813]
MKSNICTLEEGNASLSLLLDETEKTAAYSNLDKKQTGRLRLLAEELVEMLPELLSFSKGKFWIESEEKVFSLHTVLTPNESMTAERREKLLAVSSTGKNSAAIGIMSKIKLAAEFMLIDYEENATYSTPFYENGMINPVSIGMDLAWSLNSYKQKANTQKDERWDELEKSIIANIADDVLVGVQGKKVEIIVKKSF